MSEYGAAQPVVTGEAVALELRLAQLPSRALALMIDMSIQVAALVVLFTLLGVAGGSLDTAALSAFSLVLIVGVLVGYPLVWETVSRGRSVGKYAFGLRVVRDDGGSTRFRHSLVRALIEVVEIWLLLGVPALFCSLSNSRAKRFGDLAAGTVVVRERVPAKGGTRAPMPPELAGWAAATDVGRVPDDLALAAWQFLVRAPELSPQVRWSMGQRLAGDVAPWLTPPPPAGTSPERLLAAVVAERRGRDEQRMAAQARATQAWVAQPPPPLPPGEGPAQPVATPHETYGLRPHQPKGLPPATPPVAGPAADPTGGPDGFALPS
ncbi:MAG TPA: RDD family protein [Candidatus Limnocylindria bacterium]|nr:RDD family protein [Candidatus Limnocylindria bacterium]